jgi:hypothetical protein
VDSHWIEGVFLSIVRWRSLLLSLTDDVSDSSVVRDIVWKSPVDLNSVDKSENSSFSRGDMSVNVSSNTTVGDVISTITTVGGTSNDTVRSGVNTNTSGDLSSVIWILTERHQTGGLSIGLSRWFGNSHSGDGRRFTESLEVSRIHDVSSDGGSLTDQVGWESDINVELDFESGVISGGQILSNWDDKIVRTGSSGDSTLWSLVGKSGGWDVVRSVSVINTPLGVSTGGTPGPVGVGDWISDPSRGSSNLSSVSSSIVSHREDKVPWSLDDGVLGPNGGVERERELHLGFLTWSGEGLVTDLKLLGSKTDSFGGGIDSNDVKDIVGVKDRTVNGSSELVHSGLHSDRSPRSDLGARAWNDHTVSGILGQISGERHGQNVRTPSNTRSGISSLGWDSERGRKSPDVDTLCAWDVTGG